MVLFNNFKFSFHFQFVRLSVMAANLFYDLNSGQQMPMVGCKVPMKYNLYLTSLSNLSLCTVLNTFKETKQI